MKRVVPLEKALDDTLFGSKAVGLGQAIRDGLPVPVLGAGIKAS